MRLGARGCSRDGTLRVCFLAASPYNGQLLGGLQACMHDGRCGRRGGHGGQRAGEPGRLPASAASTTPPRLGHAAGGVVGAATVGAGADAAGKLLGFGALPPVVPLPPLALQLAQVRSGPGRSPRRPHPFNSSLFCPVTTGATRARRSGFRPPS